MIFTNIFISLKRISKTKWMYNDLGSARVHTSFMEAYDAIRTRGFSSSILFKIDFKPNRCRDSKLSMTQSK